MKTVTANHTPGPWQLHEDGLAVFGAGPNPQQVIDADVASPNLSTAEKQANASLIAAAPELLDAVKGLLGLVQIITFRDDLPPDLAASLKDNHRYKDADALVARIEGGQ